MDRRNGHHSSRRMVDTHCRDGVASVARLGLAGYMADPSGLQWPEGRYLGNSPEVGEVDCVFGGLPLQWNLRFICVRSHFSVAGLSNPDCNP